MLRNEQHDTQQIVNTLEKLNLEQLRNMWLRSPVERLANWREFRQDLAKHNGSVDVREILCAVSLWWEQMPFVNVAIDPYDYTSWPTAWEIIDGGQCCKYSRGIAMAWTIHFIDPDADILVARVRNKDQSDEYIVAIYNGKYALNSPYARLVDLTSEDIFDVTESWKIQDQTLSSKSIFATSDIDRR